MPSSPRDREVGLPLHKGESLLEGTVTPADEEHAARKGSWSAIVYIDLGEDCFACVVPNGPFLVMSGSPLKT
jgi:hypothetical protein